MFLIKLPMLTKPDMRNSIDSIIARASNIARWLFFINLIPTVIAGGVIFITFNKLEQNSFRNIYDWIVLSLMLSGIALQYIYYRQTTNTDNVLNPVGWVFSIIVNAIFIVSYLVRFFSAPSFGALMIVYPAAFLVCSVKGLRLIRHFESSYIS